MKKNAYNNENETFLLQDCISSGVPFLNESTLWSGLRGFRERLSLGCISIVLRTMGLHSGRMYGNGNTERHNQSFRFWVFHGRTHCWPDELWYLHSRQKTHWYRRQRSTTRPIHVWFCPLESTTTYYPEKSYRASEWFARLEEPWNCNFSLFIYIYFF